jgi:F-type H+-transporting ATPase subunit delta
MKRGSITQYAEILYALTEGQKANDIPKILKTYLAFLSRKKALGKMKKILEKFEAIESDKNGTLRAQLVSANPLTDAEKKEITNVLLDEMKVKDIILSEKIDENLIAGWKIKTENYLIDGSTRGKLNKLQLALTK